MIRVENLTRYFDGLCAVDRINLEIRKGEILGLLGPNGAGKTTTLRMLTGFLRPTSGVIRVKGLSLDENALEVKKLIGYLPESAPLYPEMLVYDYLRYVAKLRGLPKEQRLSRIRRVADLCGLKEVMHTPIGVLSRGYKQRVGLAYAMMSNPEILVLDEPTSGLDPNQIVEIREIIRQIGKERTVIFSTHILSEAEATCDRIVIIHRGKIVADGSTESLKQAARGEYLLHITLADASLGPVEEALGSIPGILGVEPGAGEEGRLHVVVRCRSSEGLRAEIYRKIKETDWVLLEFRRETRTLENIFRELTVED